MPTRYLSADQRSRFGRLDNELSPDILAKYFVLDPHDLGVIRNFRGPRNQLGYATLLSSVRFIGTFPDQAEDVPSTALAFLRTQIGIESGVTLVGYFQSRTFERHVRSIREQYGFIHFADATHRRLGLTRWLYAQCWAGGIRPGTLILLAADWLIGRRVILPRISTLEPLGRSCTRACATAPVASYCGWADARAVRADRGAFQPGCQELWRPGILRAGPLKRRQSDFLRHLDRLDVLRSAGWGLTPPKAVPAAQLERLARVARRGKPSAIAALKEPRRTATVAALFYTLEASAQDDAVELGEALISDLFREAELAQASNRQAHQRELDRAFCCCVTWPEW